MPIAGVDPRTLQSNFSEARGGHAHEALDIMAPRGTPVLAVAEGNVVKLFTSKQGGLTVYQFDNSRTWCYYYAHLDRYAPALKEGHAPTQGRCAGLCRIHRRCIAERSAPALRGLSTRSRKALVARYRHRSAPPAEVRPQSNSTCLLCAYLCALCVSALNPPPSSQSPSKTISQTKKFLTPHFQPLTDIHPRLP